MGHESACAAYLVQTCDISSVDISVILHVSLANHLLPVQLLLLIQRIRILVLLGNSIDQTLALDQIVQLVDLPAAIVLLELVSDLSDVDVFTWLLDHIVVVLIRTHSVVSRPVVDVLVHVDLVGGLEDVVVLLLEVEGGGVVGDGGLRVGLDLGEVGRGLAEDVVLGRRGSRVGDDVGDHGVVGEVGAAEGGGGHGALGEGGALLQGVSVRGREVDRVGCGGDVGLGGLLEGGGGRGGDLEGVGGWVVELDGLVLGFACVVEGYEFVVPDMCYEL